MRTGGETLAKISYWTTHWGLALDPFSEEPLYYNSENFEKLLVRYAPIQEIDEILANLYKEKKRLMRKRYYVIGLRGMGKTTILNYIVRKTLEKPQEKIMSVYINNVHVKDPDELVDPARDPEKLRLNFCLRTIEALFNTILHAMKESANEYSSFEKIRAKYFELRGKTPIDQATAESLLREYLDKLRKSFDVFILLYDELDKIDDYNTVLRFLRSSQGLLETLSEYGCVLFLCGIPDFSRMLRSSEYSGVGGHEIRIHTWSASDAKALIKSRLDYALYTGEFPFKDKVVETICSRAGCRPRLIQSQTRDALVWGAYQHLKMIDEKFLNSMMWEETALARFKAEVRARKDLEEGAKILRKVYDPDRDDPAIYFLLMRIFRVVSVQSFQLREKCGIDMELSHLERLMHLLMDFNAVKLKQAGGKRYYVLEERLEHLLSYVKRVLKQSLEYLPRAVKLDFAEIKELKLGFTLRNEVTKILVMNPQRRYRRIEFAKEIVNNSDSRTRATEHYGVSSEKDLKSKLLSALATVLHSLKREGVVIEMSTGSRVSYQFSKAVEHLNWARNIRLDEDVLQNYQSAVNTLNQGDLCGSVPLLRLAVENSLRHLSATLEIELPDRAKLDTLGPINERLYQSKIYDQGTKAMIDAFNIEVGPIVHGAIKLEDMERARNLVERCEIILRNIYSIKKDSLRK